MYYKPDWDKAKERVKGFWKGEIIDRCCIAVFAPRKTSKYPSFPELQLGPWLGGLEKFSNDDHESIRKWWIDPEENYKRMKFWFENTYFGGEAIPATYVNWGAMAMASFYGSEPIFRKNTVWYNPIIESWETWEWNFDKETNEYWQHIKSIVNFLIKRSDEGYFVGTPEFGSAGDILSLLRGPGELAIDLIEQKSKVKEAINIIANTWVELHEEIYKMTKNINDNGDILPWMSLWAPGRHDQIACDYSTLISPQLFKEFFVPEIKIEGDWCEYSTYHLDGPDAMKNHLETLLKIEEIDNIEWTPGIGMPPTLTPEYIPNYKKIQKMGKKLYLLVKPWEIESLLNDLSPKGLFIHTNVDSEDEANKLLKNIEKWSCK